MAERKIYFGSYGPFFYDDADVYSTPEDEEDQGFGDGEAMGGVVTDGATVSASIKLWDTNTSNTLEIKWNENDTSDRVLNLLVVGGDRSFTLNGNLTVEDNSIVSQDYTSNSATVTFAKLTLTSTQATLLDLNPGVTGSASIIDITPSAAIGTEDALWEAIKVNGQNLDPSAINVELHGFHADFSGVNVTNSPMLYPAHFIVPPTAATGLRPHVLFLEEGCIFHRVNAGSLTAAEYRAYDLAIDVSNLDQYAHYHALDVEITGTLVGEVSALATNTGISPIHQHLETWTAHNQTTGAFRYVSSFTAGVDGNECWVANGDYIILGHTSKWDAFEVIMTSKATKNLAPTFWYMNGSSAWVQFSPVDGTDGFQFNGRIEWDSDGFTDWDNAQDPTSNSGLSGYWIKIVRTRNADPGTPTPTNIKYLSALTEYDWNKDGDVSINSLVLATVAAAGTDTDKFLVLDGSGNIDYRTGANVLSDIGAEAAGAMTTHESTYNHANYDTAYAWGDHASGGYAASSHAMSTHSDEDTYNLATSGSILSSGTGGVTSGSASNTGKIVIYDGSDHAITITSPSIAASYTLTLPTTDGDPDEYLQTNGSGGLTWVAGVGGGAAFAVAAVLGTL